MQPSTFLEALQYAQAKKIVLPEEFYSLDLQTRQYANTVGLLSSIEQIQTVLNAVNKSIADGSTFDDFKKIVAENGINLPESYLDNVFRTNIQSAYAYGRWQHQQQNKSSRPYLMYSAIEDSRVRPSHLALNNIIRHIDDPFWLSWYPPNGFRCRCSVIAITEKKANKLGITNDEDMPDLPSENGFNFNPWNFDEQTIQFLNSRLSSSTITSNLKDEIERIKSEVTIESKAINQIQKSLSRLDDVKRGTLDEMVNKTIKLDPNIRPSDLRITLDLSDENENALTNILKQSEIQKDQQGTIGKSIWDKIIGAFNRLFSFAKNTANKLTGSSIRGIDDLNLTAGNVIGIKTPTLFREAEKVGKQIIILDAKGVAIDLSKISSLDGSLLAPDLSLEVVSNSDDQLVLKRTDKQAVRYFIANQNAFSLF
ncbi:phage head morphogenesis protein [Acinetobacter higginsii]|uniref:phage head morphogenesis protein n=1 Tax=Acinetobacter higginsii TaxID=70347 RepID=UPI0026757884|nr:phage minor head protein [Acinetobacter higginsii]MDO3663400.1 phage minor head protein [Acinetobacter higginsii]